MKKNLLYLSILLGGTLFAQEIQAYDFNGLIPGNIGTDITGVTPGQDNWLTFVSTGGTNGGNDNFQVLESNGSNALLLTGSNAGSVTGATGSRFMWKDGFPDLWADRTTGNNIIEVEFDINTQELTASLNSFRIYIFEDVATNARVLAGMGVTINGTAGGSPFSNIVTGFAHWSSTPGTGTYQFGLGPAAASPVLIEESTWTRLGFSFNTTTGIVTWKGSTIPAAGVSHQGSMQFPVTTAGAQPGEIDIIAFAGTNNTTAHSVLLDNIVVRASATDTLLSTNATLQPSSFSLSPNPASNVLNIAGEINFKDVIINDANGRQVKSQSFDLTTNKSIDISDLQAGIYLVTIVGDQGKVTKKIIKN